MCKCGLTQGVGCAAEVYDIMPASELDPRMGELGMSAIVLEAPSYTLRDWIPYGDHDPKGTAVHSLHSAPCTLALLAPLAAPTSQPLASSHRSRQRHHQALQYAQ